MKSLSARITGAFLLTQIVFVAVLAVIFLIGYNRSLSLWQEEREFRLLTFARSMLSGGLDPADAEPPATSPLFIFNDRRELVWSNRGGARMHMMMNPSPLTPVRENGQIVGYLRAGSQSFADDAANTAFVGAMGRVILIDVVFTLCAGIVLAVVLSRSLANPARLLALRLDRMAEGDLSSPVSVRGPGEIASIARSAARLGRQLETEKESRERWTADLAHDLKTPLSAMKAQFEAMADGVLDPSPERLKMTLGELARMEELVASLEELMRLESPEITVEKREIEIRPLFDGLVARFKARVAQKDVRTETEIRETRVQADPGLLERALSNIMANAVRHVEEHGTIRLFSGRDGDRVVIGVTNSGRPIPPEELPRLFDRLYRGEYARATPGSGLGLTIVRQIIDLHGGSIAVSSSAAAGTEVALRLPIG